ncbi:hypothetical protein [Phaffia rhodozyma]|uniref:Uncharacterized protein n=1 Tax=Phaffia rhodozyma TaxID=264483 RepID=A0A0F7SLA9_PHARH|nr:hypothetical protein [Phaffia rhodozyma]
MSESSVAQEEALCFLTENELTRSGSDVSVTETDVSSAVRHALNESMAKSLQTFIRYLNPDNSRACHPLNLVQQIADAQSTVRENESELDRLYESISSDRERVTQLISDVQALLANILGTWPPIIFSAESSIHTNLLQKLSALLLKLSLLPLRQHDILLKSHPNLQAAMATYQETILRRTARAQKETDELKGEIRKYQMVTERSKGEFERLMRTKSGLDAARAKVELELEELRRAIMEH